MNGWMDRESTPIWQMMATKAFHTSQHVTGPPNKAQASLSAACSSQEDAARDQPGSTACLCCCSDPVESGQHGLPAAAPALPVSEARRQTPCMPAWHSWETRRARRGRGREAAAWGGGHGGRVGEVDMVKEAGGGGQTDRDMEERTDYEKNQQCWRRLWRRTGEEHGSWFHVREEGVCQKRQTVGLGEFKAMEDFSRQWATL